MVGGRVGAGLRGRGGGSCDVAVNSAAIAAGFGAALSQCVTCSHCSQYPHRASKAFLMGGQQRGSCRRRPMLWRRRGGVRMHLPHHCAWPVIG